MPSTAEPELALALVDQDTLLQLRALVHNLLYLLYKTLQPPIQSPRECLQIYSANADDPDELEPGNYMKELAAAVKGLSVDLRSIWRFIYTASYDMCSLNSGKGFFTDRSQCGGQRADLTAIPGWRWAS